MIACVFYTICTLIMIQWCYMPKSSGGTFKSLIFASSQHTSPFFTWFWCSYVNRVIYLYELWLYIKTNIKHLILTLWVECVFTYHINHKFFYPLRSNSSFLKYVIIFILFLPSFIFSVFWMKTLFSMMIEMVSACTPVNSQNLEQLPKHNRYSENICLVNCLKLKKANSLTNERFCLCDNAPGGRSVEAC